MPLTPEDVSNKRFTAVRLREGYDMGEVDAFLDEVEAELTRLDRENAELRTKLEAAVGGSDGQVEQSTDGTTATAAVGAPARGDRESAEDTTTATTGTVEAPQPGGDTTVASLQKPGSTETLRVSTTAEASAAATRLLELATRSADELLADAQAQADTVLSGARADAQRLEEESRTRVQQLDVETDQRREQLFSELERDRASLAEEVESLRTFEREYRAELKDYFAKQLDALEHPLAHSERFGTGAEPTGARVPEPRVESAEHQPTT